MSRYIGISINDDFTDICIDGEEYQYTFPTMVCKEKKKDSWLIGEAAYKSTLNGTAVIVDKLMSLLRKDGTATIENIRYSAQELLGFFLKELLKEAECRHEAEKRLKEKAEEGEGEASAAEEPSATGIPEKKVIVLSLRKAEQRLMKSLSGILAALCPEQEEICIVSHTESFVHYVLHQDKNLYNRLVGMFELSNQCLYYYEMQVSRGTRKYVVAASEAQEEAFNLDILKTQSGGKIADRILSSLAERLMEKKAYSSVFLSGKGFEGTDFAPDFMRYLCARRRVCIEPRVFAIGCMYYAELLSRGETEEYLILCDTRVSCDVEVKVVVKEKEQRLSLVSAGDTWTDRAGSYEMILDRQDYVDFQLTPMIGARRPVQLRMLLEGFPERENRTTRIRMSTEFPDAEHLRITVSDRGFGELFPSSGAELSEEINLREALKEM